jgi:hypothetical protein
VQALFRFNRSQGQRGQRPAKLTPDNLDDYLGPRYLANCAKGSDEFCHRNNFLRACNTSFNKRSRFPFSGSAADFMRSDVAKDGFGFDAMKRAADNGHRLRHCTACVSSKAEAEAEAAAAAAAEGPEEEEACGGLGSPGTQVNTGAALCPTTGPTRNATSGKYERSWEKITFTRQHEKLLRRFAAEAEEECEVTDFVSWVLSSKNGRKQLSSLLKRQNHRSLKALKTSIEAHALEDGLLVYFGGGVRRGCRGRRRQWCIRIQW